MVEVLNVDTEHRHALRSWCVEKLSRAIAERTQTTMSLPKPLARATGLTQSFTVNDDGSITTADGRTLSTPVSLPDKVADALKVWANSVRNNPLVVAKGRVSMRLPKTLAELAGLENPSVTVTDDGVVRSRDGRFLTMAEQPQRESDPRPLES